MGSIYKRQRSRFWWIQYYQHGRVIRESTGTEKETVARRVLRAREGDVERGIVINTKVGRITFEDGADDLLKEYRQNRRRSTPSVQHRIEAHLTPFFRGRLLAGISAVDIRAFVAKRQADRIITRRARTIRRPGGTIETVVEQSREVSPAEINRELAIVKRMFTLAFRAGLLAQRPYIPMLRENNVRRGFFEPEQFESVRKNLPPHARPIVSFAHETGWRVASEILPLEWRQIDWEGRVVRLDPGTTKNGEGRIFPFTVAVERILREQLAEHERLKKAGRIVPLVFHRDGQRVREFRKAWRKACIAAGIPGRILHDFRRTAVRNLERAGVSRSAAMAMVGHKTEAIYRRYAIVDAAMLREAALKIDRERTLAR